MKYPIQCKLAVIDSMPNHMVRSHIINYDELRYQAGCLNKYDQLIILVVK